MALTLLLPLAGARGAAVPGGFGRANEAYSRGDFQTARDGYAALVKEGAEGHRSANLFYNLGNAEYRLGDKGAAILAYQRALALDPSHPEAGANLRLLREATGARVALPSWRERLLLWPQSVLHGHAAWLAAVAFWGICFSVLPVFRKRNGAAWLPALAAGVVLAWAGSAVAWEATRGAAWIVTAESVRARTAPADSSKAAGTLPCGSLVRLVMERGEWLYVTLPEGTRGWIARAEAEPIVPPVR